MIAIKNLFNALVATALISGINALPAPQAVGDLVATLYAAADNYENLHDAVKAFDGQVDKYTDITHNRAAVEASLLHAIDAANATAPLSTEDSNFVMQALAQPYPEFMGKLLDDIVAKVSHSFEVWL
jgi:hypothetical protein